MTLLPSLKQFELILGHDFYSFFQEAFRTLHPNLSYEESWHAEVICRAVTDFMGQDADQNLVANAPPRSLKSEIVSVALVAYLLGKNPSLRILCVSYSQQIADAFARDTRTVMDADWYRRIFPTMRIKRSNENGIFTTKGGYRRTISVGGSVTGYGSDLTIIDDPIRADDVTSEAIREKTNNWLDTTLASRANDKRKAKTILVMQRLHVDDPSSTILRRKLTRHLKLPAIADKDYRFELSPGRFKCWDADEPLHDERLHLGILAADRENLGERTFLAQYLQEPVPLDGGMIKWAWFKFYNELPAYRSTDRRIFSWDTALSDAGTADYSVCTEWLVRDRQFYLVNVTRARLIYPDLRHRIAAQNEAHGNAVIIVEDKGSGMSVAQDLKRDGINVISYKPETSKEQRASIASVQIESGNVLLPHEAHWLAEFQSECLAFPNGRHDDQVDSMSQAILWWMNRPKPATAIFGSY